MVSQVRTSQSTVADVMDPLLIVGQDTPLRVVVRRMLVCHISAAAVLDDRSLLVGLITGEELVRAELPGWDRTLECELGIRESLEPWQPTDKQSVSTARDLMRVGVVTVMDHEPEAEAAQQLQGQAADCAVVIRNGTPVGLFRRFRPEEFGAPGTQDGSPDALYTPAVVRRLRRSRIVGNEATTRGLQPAAQVVNLTDRSVVIRCASDRCHSVELYSERTGHT